MKTLHLPPLEVSMSVNYPTIRPLPAYNRDLGAPSRPKTVKPRQEQTA
jgi:hypothetical protein